MSATATEVGTAPVGSAPSREPGDARGTTARLLASVAAWAVLLAVASVWGVALLDAHVHMQIGAPPLTGAFGWHAGPALLALAAAGTVGALVLPTLIDRLSWRGVLVVAPLVTVTWAIAVNVVDGWAALTSPIATEYSATAAGVTSPSAFFRALLTHGSQFNLHTRGHPPGMVVVLWALRPLGVSGAATVAALYIAAGALAIPAALVAVADVAGRGAARAAAPFLVLFPGAIWTATSADAFFAGVSAWAIALVVLATGRRDRRGDLLSLAGGALFGITAFLSYGLVLLALIPVAVAISRRRARPLALAVLGAAPVFLVVAVAGFWWLDGLRVTRAAYVSGVARRRPYGYFVVADLAAFAIAAGPAAAVALAWLRDRRIAVVAGAGLAVVALADLSGMSKGEVERIWLPFVPWVLVATAAFAGRRRGRAVRVLLVLQVATAVVVQAFVRSPW